MAINMKTAVLVMMITPSSAPFISPGALCFLIPKRYGSARTGHPSAQIISCFGAICLLTANEVELVPEVGRLMKTSVVMLRN